MKSYPIVSSRYVELVCTAGIREDGSWLRIYPIPFRTLPEFERFRKFDIVEGEFYKNESDNRPESFRPLDYHSIRTVKHVGTEQSWLRRRQLILERAKVYQDLAQLIEESKLNETSLAVFKPTNLIDFYARRCEATWDRERLEKAESMLMYNDLFDKNAWRGSFNIVEKLPFDFSYKFEDVNGKSSTMKILDWETGALFRNCLERANGDSKRANQDVRHKYFEEFRATDLHFFLGTTQRFHSRAPNPFTIVGVFPIPHKPPYLFD